MAIYKNVEPLGMVSWTATGHHEYDEWLGAKGIDPEKVIAEKHDYNTKRPYRHGKKY